MKPLFLLPLALVGILSCSEATGPGALLTNTASADLSSMHVGDVRVLTFSQAQQGLTIPADLSAARYVVVVANVAGDTGTVPEYTVNGNRESVAGMSRTAVSALPRRPAATVLSPLTHPAFTRVGGARGAQFEATLRRYVRSHVRPGAQRRTATSPLLRADNVPVGTVPSVGQQFQFNVPGNGTDLCTTFSTVTATVEAVSNHAIIVTDNQALNNGFTTASYDSIAHEFDTYIYPTEVGYFGPPTDIDHNGRVFILFTPAVNLLTPTGTVDSQGFVGGYTFPGDFLPPTPESQGGCPESNQAEIFYLMVPDANGQFGNSFSTAFVKEQTRSTMAHEFQHAINEGNRFLNPAVTSFESAWLDEALSSFAEDAVGRAELGYSDLQLLTSDAAFNMDTTLFNTFFAENFTRTQLYVTRPDTIGPLVTDNREEADLAAFGAGWAFLRYTADWFSNSAPRTLTTALVAGPDTGTVNLTTHTGVPLDTLLAHWLVTLYTDGQSIPNLPAQYNYRTYALRNIVSAFCADPSCTATSYLPVQSIGNGSTSITLGVPSSSADYFITDQTTGGARTITVTTPGSSSAATDPFGRIYVVRVQ